MSLGPIPQKSIPTISNLPVKEKYVGNPLSAYPPLSTLYYVPILLLFFTFVGRALHDENYPFATFVLGLTVFYFVVLQMLYRYGFFAFHIHSHWRYAKYLFRHKYYVFVEGRKLGLPAWQLLAHDLSKFNSLQWVAYVNYFNGKYERNIPINTPYYSLYEVNDFAEYWFMVAWAQHQHIEKHHWQYHLTVMDKGVIIALPIPDKYFKEMLADWLGVAHTFGASSTEVWAKSRQWYLANRDHMILHDTTRQKLDAFYKAENE